MSNEIRAEVARILDATGVTFVATYHGERKDALGNSGCVMDEWDCHFTKQAPDGTHKTERFEFFTGLGLRAEATAQSKAQTRDSFPGLSEKDIENRTIYGRRYLAEVEKLRKPQTPHAADVLHSLILDSSAVGQSFESWCDDFGYDTDSRKAEATYRACQANADKLARVLNANDRKALETALQDY